MRKRSAFTLTELLVVIAIIGMLAALVTVAARAAMAAARRGVIKMELTQLDMALEQYKNKYGEYPPDGTDSAAVVRHLRKCFPNASLPNEQDIVGMFPCAKRCDGEHEHQHAAEEAGIVRRTLTPASALVLFLGGNLAKNPIDPLSLAGDRVDAFYEFKPSQLGDDEDRTDAVYYPSGMERDRTAPFVYFKARLLGDAGVYATVVNKKETPLSFTTANAGVAVPYADGTPNPDNLSGAGTGDLTKWRNATKYQIVTAGLDGLFGAQGLLGSRTSNYGAPEIEGAFQWDEAVYDNLTNFAAGTLGDELEE